MTDYLFEVLIDLEAETVTGTVTPKADPIDPGGAVEAPVIHEDQWTAVLDPDRGVGHRRVEVDADVMVPEGYEIRLYSGGTQGGKGTPGSAAIVPGVPYETKNPLAPGTTCYNSLWWLNAGAITPASENEIVLEIT